MPDVAKKIITANPQRGGGIVSMAGAKALSASEKISANYEVGVPVQKDQPVTVIEARLDTRLDDVRYYSGDSSS